MRYTFKEGIVDIKKMMDNATASVEFEFQRKVSQAAKEITERYMIGELCSEEAIKMIIKLHLGGDYNG